MNPTGIALPELHLRISYFGSRRFARRSERRLISPNWIVHWNQTRTARVWIEDRARSLGPSDLLLIPPRCPVHEVIERGEEHTYIHFEVNAESQQRWSKPFALRVSPWQRRILATVARNFRAGDIGPVTTYHVRGIVCAALAMLPQDAWDSSITDPRLLRVIRFIQDNLQQCLTNPDLARLSSMSTNGFIRFFTQAMKCPPQRYVQRTRCDRAAALLVHSQETIKEISAVCGFCDRSYFSTVFHRQYGFSPAQYRRGAWES